MTYNYMTYLGGDILIGPVGNSVPAAPAPCFRYLESGSSIGFEIAMGNGPFVDYFHLKFLKWWNSIAMLNCRRVLPDLIGQACLIQGWDLYPLYLSCMETTNQFPLRLVIMQPFISGGSSNSDLYPRLSTVGDIKSQWITGHDVSLMLKPSGINRWYWKNPPNHSLGTSQNPLGNTCGKPGKPGVKCHGFQ